MSFVITKPIPKFLKNYPSVTNETSWPKPVWPRKIETVVFSFVGMSTEYRGYFYIEFGFPIDLLAKEVSKIRDVKTKLYFEIKLE